MPAPKDPRLRRTNAIGGYDRARPDELPELYSRGDRRCFRDGCITILNMYNPGPYCLLDTQRLKAERRAAEALS
jgi:hypothetical protein